MGSFGVWFLPCERARSYWNSPRPAGEFNDLWKFDLSTRSWTFITGQQGMAPPQDNRFPAPRSDALRWVENDTYLCIFGGFTIRGMFYQDMWRYLGLPFCRVHRVALSLC
jgi:hypothetical protein